MQRPPLIPQRCGIDAAKRPTPIFAPFFPADPNSVPRVHRHLRSSLETGPRGDGSRHLPAAVSARPQDDAVGRAVELVPRDVEGCSLDGKVGVPVAKRVIADPLQRFQMSIPPSPCGDLELAIPITLPNEPEAPVRIRPHTVTDVASRIRADPDRWPHRSVVVDLNGKDVPLAILFSFITEPPPAGSITSQRGTSVHALGQNGTRLGAGELDHDAVTSTGREFQPGVLESCRACEYRGLVGVGCTQRSSCSDVVGSVIGKGLIEVFDEIVPRRILIRVARGRERQSQEGNHQTDGESQAISDGTAHGR